LATIGDFEEASDLVAQVRDDVSALGESEWSPAVALTGARVHLAAGHMDAAAAEAEAGLALAKALGTSAVEPLGHWVLASVALLGGDLTETGNRVAAYRAALPPLANAVGSASYLLIEARLSEAQHGPEGAVALLQPVYDDLRAHRLELVIDPTMAASLARNAVAVGAHETADAVVADAEAIAADNPGVACLSAAAAQARGIAARDVVSLDEAAVRHRHPWARASALEDGGGLLAASDRTAARVHFQRGLDGYEHVAADRDAERMRSRLRRLDRKHRRSDPRPVEGWGSLTDNERRVSHLVAQGLTNSQTAERMFLSRHTIDFHLRQIFRKLSISSRVELARIAITRERR
jgi:DNA-binding CsgD family transcriptional regulator